MIREIIEEGRYYQFGFAAGTHSFKTKKVRLNRVAWSGSLFQILKQGIEEIIAYKRGEIALRVTTIDDEGNRKTEYRRINDP